MIAVRVKLLVFSLLFLLAAVIILCGMLLHALVGSPAKGLALARSFDRSVNVLIGGSESETISSHIGRMQRDGDLLGKLLAPCIDFFFGKDHCKSAIGV